MTIRERTRLVAYVGLGIWYAACVALEVFFLGVSYRIRQAKIRASRHPPEE